MKLPGNITLDELYAAYVSPGGYRPRVKIHLQELLEGGRVGHAFRELTHWTQVSIHRALGGKGRATISLANTDDRHFNNRAARVFRPEKSQATKGYLSDLHRRVLSRVKEINPTRRAGVTRDFQGLRSFTESDVTSYVNFLYNFDGWNGGLRSSIAGGQADLPALGLLQRVIIDAQGPDGRWYALFTGIVSNIEDRYQPGDTPMIELVCSDYWRLFDLSEIIVQTGPDPIADNLQTTLLGRLAEAGPLSNNLSEQSGPKILQIVMDVVQRTMCWIPYAIWKQGQVQGSPASMPDGQTSGLQLQDSAGPFIVTARDPGLTNASGQTVGATQRSVQITQKDFFNDEPFWYIRFADNGDEPETYEGHDTLRHYTQALPQVGIAATRKSDGDEPTDGMPVAQLYSTLLVDKYISGHRIEAQIYQQLIAAILAPWQSNKTLGSAIIKRVADATFYDLLVTPNGDLLYQIPKYNNCPGEYRPTGNLQTTPTGEVVAPTGAAAAASAVAEFATSVVAVVVPIAGVSAPAAPAPASSATGFSYDTTNWPEGDLDYAPAPEGFSQRGHGFNYALTSLGNRGWRLYSSEEGLVTTVRVPAGQELIKLDDTTRTATATGRTQVDDTQDLVARFGLRVFEAQQLFIKSLYSVGNRKEILDKLAKALLIQINGRAMGGSTDLHFRPDLDLGKNVFHIERQRLLYIMGVTHTIRYGQDSSTSLQLAFGHDITREIVSPFVSVEDPATLTPPTATEAVTPAAGVATQPAATVAVAAPGGGTQQAPLGRDSVSGYPITAPGNINPAQLAAGATGGGPAAPVSTTAAQTADFVVPRATWEAIPGFKVLRDRIRAAKDFQLTTGTSVPFATIGGRAITYVTTPPGALLAAAIQKVRDTTKDPSFTMTIDEYALARCIQSEAGVTPELIDSVLVAQTQVNVSRSSGGVAALLVKSNIKKPGGLKPANGFFGAQAGRQASTDKDPSYKAFLVARGVLSGSLRVANVFPGLTNYCAIRAFSTQPGVTRNARGVLMGIDGKAGWVQTRTWIGTLTPLSSFSRTIFFQGTGVSTARKIAGRIAVDNLLKSFKL